MKERRAVGERGRAGRTGRMDGWTDGHTDRRTDRPRASPKQGPAAGRQPSSPLRASGEQPASTARQLPSRPPLLLLLFFIIFFFFASGRLFYLHCDNCNFNLKIHSLCKSQEFHSPYVSGFLYIIPTHIQL